MHLLAKQEKLRRHCNDISCEQGWWHVITGRSRHIRYVTFLELCGAETLQTRAREMWRNRTDCDTPSIEAETPLSQLRRLNEVGDSVHGSHDNLRPLQRRPNSSSYYQSVAHSPHINLAEQEIPSEAELVSVAWK